MKKVRVDFSAHKSIVVAVKEGDDYFERAMDIASEYANMENGRVFWEIDDGGVDDAMDTDDVDVTEE